MILIVRCRNPAVAKDRNYLLSGSPRSLADNDSWLRMFSNVPEGSIGDRVPNVVTVCL